MFSRNPKVAVLALSRKFMQSAAVKALLMGFLAMGFTMPIRAQGLQEPSTQASSVVEAARNARERALSSGKHPKIITNADLGDEAPISNDSTFDLQLPSANAAEEPNLSTAECDNPRAEGLQAELQAAQQELEQLRRDLQYNPPVVSDRDLDPQYFRPGSSGFNVGSPPLLDTEPPAPGRVAEVELEERIDRLQKDLRLACQPPEAAKIQSELDAAQQELDLLQRQFALDQEDYYSIPVTERLGGNPQLDAEQQQVEDLQAEIQSLRERLAALISPQLSR